MKGIVLAGGTGSRLHPLTKVTNKHLLPVGKKPMIYYPIEKLTGAGIEEILIVTGVEHVGSVVNLLGSGVEFKCRFTYKVQDQAGGIAQAIGLAENFSKDDQMCIILGDNIFEDSIAPFAESFRKQGKGGKIILKEVDHPERFGVAEIENGKIRRIVEKPKAPKSNQAVTGIYFYDAEVFSITKNLKPSARGELEVTDINNHYLNKGQLTHDYFKGWWTDAGTFDSLALANNLVREQE